MLEYKIKDEKLITNTPLFTVLNLEIEKEPGKVTDFVFLNSLDWVKVIGKTVNDKYIMVKQWRPGNGISLEIPGGKIDNGETPIEAGLRELEEETGYIKTDNSHVVDLGCHFANPAFLNNKMYYFYVDNLIDKGTKNEDDFERVYTVLYSKEDLCKAIKDNKIEALCSMLGLMKVFHGA
jgi:ADP-ribose pyrophosphatase